jgi:hypothetical protein
MTKFVEKFNYHPIPRVTIEGKRFYATPDGNKLPSVTTILDKTKSEDSKAALSLPVYLDTVGINTRAPFEVHAWPLLVGMLAETANQFGQQVTRDEPIGVILCFLSHLSPFVSKLKEVTKPKATDVRQTLSQMVSAERTGKDRAALTPRDYAQHLLQRPHMWRPFIRESTAINGAGSDFNFVLCYAPRLNRLTNDTSAAIVSYSRHKRLLIFLAPFGPACRPTINSVTAALYATAGSWGGNVAVAALERA